MKLPALTLAILFGTIALAPAQSPAPAALAQTTPSSKGQPGGTRKEPKVDGNASLGDVATESVAKGNKGGAATDPNMNPDGSVTLAAGTLENVVAEIERRVPHWTSKPNGEAWTLPNVLYGADAREAVVSGALTLRAVSPLQALTLAAAAAGCKLEPIAATKEDIDYQNGPPAIIGYRIVLDHEVEVKRGMYSGMPSLAARYQPPGKGPDTSKTSQSNAAPKSDSNVPGRSFDSSFGSIYSASPAAANVPAADPASTPPTASLDGNRRFVRVYSLGSILSGTKEEIAMKQAHLQDLVSTAMEQSEPEPGKGSETTGKAAKNEFEARTKPELSFHLELRALIVRGTAAQHEIIEQVMKVLKENESNPPAQRGN